MPSQPHSNNPPTSTEQALDTLLRAVQQLASELHPQQTVAVTLDSSLERDLGLDSLSRVELVLRIQQHFGVSLPEQLLLEAETPRDLLNALLAASPVPALAALTSPAAEQAELEPASHLQHAGTLLEVLDWHVRNHPQRTHILLEDSSGEQKISYAELQHGAAAVAAGLLEYDLQPGQAVAIMLPTSRDYFFSFFGILLAGAVPVPIYPPARLSQIEDHLRRHAGILSNALAAVLITVPQALAIARLLQAQVASLQAIVTLEQLAARAPRSAPLPNPVVKTESVALLQYTSGSTGDPKGVVLSHANLLANIRAMGQAAQVSSADVFVSWLPLYHDMGLIGAWLGSLYYGLQLAIMSPLVFLAQPSRWLWSIHRHRATLSAAPNFAYELCLRKISDSALTGLDLSSWRMAFNGAEPVSPTTLLGFSQRFARYGLRAETMAPVYGLAECSVGLCFPPLGRGPLIDRIQRDLFLRTGRAVPAENKHDALRFVACGQPLPGHQIRIVDAAGHELGEREQGRLEFKGPSATSGYFRNPEQTRKLMHGAWLDSGDFAYLANGDLYLTGRAKDTIIRGGRNLYPYELEEAVGNLAGIRKGCVAVFGSPDPVSGTERLVVMAETRETAAPALENRRRQINTISLDILGMPPDDIVLVPPHSVLKTSSGKIRRAACRELYQMGASGAPQRAVWRQLLRLARAGVLPQLRRSLKTAREYVFAAYAWTLFWLLAGGTWCSVMLTPKPAAGWAISRFAARLFLRLCAAPFSVQGLENLPRTPCILVANHASYLDSMLLVAALPGRASPSGYFNFVAKRELLDKFSTRIYLRRIGANFVERFDPQRGGEDLKQLALALRAGKSLLFFPEGTFTRAPGLTPFRLGAFVLATETGLPVVPIALRGTRAVLLSDQWFPRRGKIAVIIGKPLTPQGRDWAAAIQLRTAARQDILRGCGEPDLGA